MPNDPVIAPQRPTVCPSCGATVRTDVPWCGLCYSSLALPAGPAPATDPATEPVVPALEAPPPSTVDLVADEMLATLAAERTPSTWAGRLPTSKGGRAGAIAVCGLVGTVLLIGAMTLVGLFL